MFNSLYLRVKFAFCSVVLGAIFALTGAAFAAEDFAVVADKNAAESGDAKIGEGFRYSDFARYGGFNSSTEFSSSPFSLNSEPFDLPAEEFGAAEGGGGLIEFLSSPLGGFVIAAGIFAGATAIDKNNRDDNNTPSTVAGDGTTPSDPTPQCSDGMVADRNGDCVVEQSCTATGEEMDGFGDCRCDAANNYVDDGNGMCIMQQVCTTGETPDGIGGCQCDVANNYVDDGAGACVMQQLCTTGEIADGIGGCQCDAANNYVDDGAGMCVMQQVCTTGETPDGIGGCECPTGTTENPAGSGMCVANTELALRAMCAADSSLERRIFARPGGSITGLGGSSGTAALSLSIRAIHAIISPGSGGETYDLNGINAQWFRADFEGTGTFQNSDGLTSDGLPRRSSATLTEGMRVALSSPVLTPTFDDIFIVYADENGELFLAENVNAGGNDETENGCTAGADEFFLDDNWMPTQNLGDSRMTFPFNLREGLRGLLDEKRAVRLKNFFFTANDSQLRDFHLEHRFHLFGEANESATGESPNPSGFSAFAESGYKRQNGGRTALHYNKLTAIRDFAGGMSFYAQGISGRINSEIYRNTRLQGFAAGVFADKILSHDDSYHLRIESPLSAPQIARTRMAIDARIGEPENYWRVGFYRSLEEKKSAAKLFWLREF